MDQKVKCESYDYLSSLITSTKWASLLSLKFLDRRGMSAEWSMPIPAPLHVFFSFSCSISHSDVWLLFSASSWGLSRPFTALGLRPKEAAGEHFRFEESYKEKTVEKETSWIPRKAKCDNGSLFSIIYQWTKHWESVKPLLMDLCAATLSVAYRGVTSIIYYESALWHKEWASTNTLLSWKKKKPNIVT